MSGSVSFLREFLPPEDLERAIASPSATEAFQAGVTEGRRLERARIDDETKDALDDIKAVLEQGQDMRRAIVDAVQADAGNAVASVVRALCPALAEKGLAETARDLLTDALKAVPRPIEITAAPIVVDALSDALDAEDNPDLLIQAQDDHSSLQVSFNWSGGSAKIDFDAVANDILAHADTLGTGSSITQERDE